MPRRGGLVAGQVYHVLNRSNNGEAIFRKPHDYQAFLSLIKEAKKLFKVLIYGYCLMPNHYHLIICPLTDTALSEFMHWLLGTHAHRYHVHYTSGGHIWQGRFKHFIIQDGDEHFYRVMRYVERNPLRAGLVEDAYQWQWSSFRAHAYGYADELLDQTSIAIPQSWREYVREPITEDEINQMRECVKRNRPYGDKEWQKKICVELGIESTLRSRGRPRRNKSRTKLTESKHFTRLSK